ncbi:prolyl oligopeptidase family serine peptidase [Acidobacteriota bacterium]
MKKTITILSIILFITATAAAEKRPMTTDDALNIVRVGGAQITPDGQWVLYSKSELDWSKNKSETKYYMVSTEGGQAFQYIGQAGGSSFQFSPDGKYLTFRRTVEQKGQLFIMPTSGGEAVQLTKHKESVGSYLWSKDSTKIFFTANKPRTKEEEKNIKAGDDVIFVDEGPNGQNTGRWRFVYMFDIETKKETPVLEEDILLGGFDVSQDGKRLVFTAQFSNRRNDRNKTEIYMLTVGEKTKVRLTENQSPEGSVVWSPDGKSIAFTAADDKVWLNRNNKIWILDPDTKEYRLLSGGFEGSCGGLAWTPDSKSILFNGQQGANSNVFKIDANTGNIKKLTDVQGVLRVSSFSKDLSKIAYTFSDFDSPTDVYVTSTEEFKPVRLTDANPWIEKEILLADMKLIQWKSKKGFEIEGILHLPSGYQKGTPVPLILNIHGGPAGSFTNSFRASYHVYAGLGYASLSPNVRGSSGYTDKLREGNTVAQGDGIGMGDYWDLINGIDLVIKEGYADPNKLGLRGWSYGGILGGWTISHTDRFKAASIGAGVYDWTSEYGPGFNYDVRLWHIGGTPWENPEGYREQSTLTHVKNITTPTLLIHGMRDTTDTEGQSMMLFTAIKDIGKAPVRYMRVPREPHGFREPHHQRIRDIEEIKWMQKHVLGIDWTPWERKEEKKDDQKKEPEIKETR